MRVLIDWLPYKSIRLEGLLKQALIYVYTHIHVELIEKDIWSEQWNSKYDSAYLSCHNTQWWKYFLDRYAVILTMIMLSF